MSSEHGLPEHCMKSYKVVLFPDVLRLCKCALLNMKIYCLKKMRFMVKLEDGWS